MLFIVSEPTLLMLPETPDTFWYAAMDESTLAAWARARDAVTPATAAAPSKRFMSSPPMRRPPVSHRHCVTPGETGGYCRVNSLLNRSSVSEVEEGLDLEPLLRRPGEQRAVLDLLLVDWAGGPGRPHRPPR